MKNFKRFLGKYFAVALVGLFLVSTLLVGVGYATYQGISRVAVSSETQVKIDAFKDRVSQVAALDKVTCFNKIQSFSDWQLWVNKPISENLRVLKEACLEKKEERKRESI